MRRSPRTAPRGRSFFRRRSTTTAAVPVDPRPDAFHTAWVELDLPRFTTEQILDVYLARVGAS